MNLEMNREKLAEVFGGKEPLERRRKKKISLFKKAFANSSIAVRLFPVLAAITLASSSYAPEIPVEDNLKNEIAYEQQDQNFQQVSDDEEENEETDVLDDEELLLADRLNIREYGMTNKARTIEDTKAELNEQLGATYDGAVFEKETSSGKELWASEEDYEKAEEVGIENAPAGTEVKTVEGDYWEDSDGSLWLSEEKHSDFVNQSGVGSVVTEVSDSIELDEYGGYTDSEGVYHAANGERFTSQQHYVDWFNSSSKTDSTEGAQTSQETTPELDEYGGYTDSEGVYHAANGERFTSQQHYVDWFNSSSKTGSIEGAQTSQETTPELDEYGGYTDSEGIYHAANGERFTSQQHYVDWFNEQNGQSTIVDDGSNISSETSSEATPELDEYGGYTDSEGFYHDKEERLYISKQDYVEWFNSQNNNNNSESYEETSSSGESLGGSGASSEDSEEFDFEDSASGDIGQEIELDELGGYVDPVSKLYIVDGVYYTSKADYQLILQIDSQATDSSEMTIH